MAAKYSILQYDGRSDRVNSAKCGIRHAVGIAQIQLAVSQRKIEREPCCGACYRL